jgi:hypothetical protein
MEDQSVGLKDKIRSLGWRQWKWLFLVTLLFVIIVITIGSVSSLSTNEGEEILESFESNLPDIATTPIFINNFLIAVIMFIPVLGPIMGTIILHTTGVVIAATAMSVNLPGVWLLLGLLIFPFAWLEFISYSIAITQSIFLVIGLLRSRFKNELFRTAFLILTVFVMLFVAAFIEAILILAL